MSFLAHFLLLKHKFQMFTPLTKVFPLRSSQSGFLPLLPAQIPKQVLTEKHGSSLLFLFTFSATRTWGTAEQTSLQDLLCTVQQSRVTKATGSIVQNMSAYGLFSHTETGSGPSKCIFASMWLVRWEVLGVSTCWGRYKQVKWGGRVKGVTEYIPTCVRDTMVKANTDSYGHLRHEHKNKPV